MKSINEIAEDNFKRFCLLDGSEYIASEFALKSILRLVDTFKLRSILELGMGIGAVVDTVYKYKEENKLEISYYGTEANEYCLSVLPKNVDNYSEVKSYLELKDVEDNKFDFIVIDGLDDSIRDVKNYCSENAILFIEGDRQLQLKTVFSLFPNHLYARVITTKKNPTYVQGGMYSDRYIGGGQLIFTNPTFKMKLYWMKMKVSTFINYKIRMRKSSK